MSPRGSNLKLPAFIPSISRAAKTELSPIGHLRALVEWEVPSLLVSAYDAMRMDGSRQAEYITLLTEAINQGTTVFLDSGGYEVRWLEDETWSWSEYVEALRLVPHSVVFTYDHDFPVKKALREAQEIEGEATGVIPILHGSDTQVINEYESIEELDPQSIAVTERELGADLFDIAYSLKRLRKVLGPELGIHMLGAGHPISIALYSAIGADTFDGLDWCQTVADPETGLMHHSKHLVLYSRGTAAGRVKTDFHLRLLGHNVSFYAEWMELIRNNVEDGDPSDFIRGLIGDLPDDLL